MEKTEERTVLPGYLYWTVVVVTLFIIFFPSIFAPRKEGLSTVPTVHHASKQSLRFSYRYDEFSELVLKPNRTYTIRFLQAGTSGTFYAPAMRRVRIKSPIHHTTIFPDTSFGESGNRGWLGNKKAYERFKIFSADIQDITITTSG